MGRGRRRRRGRWGEVTMCGERDKDSYWLVVMVASSSACVYLQGQNRLDGRLYAIKRIPIRSGSKMMDRITREVELLSQMNHENVVR